MKFNIISIFPEMIEQALSCGVVGRGVKNNTLSVNIVNLRDFATDKYQSVDDKPYGGGDGMLLKPEPMAKALASLGIKNTSTSNAEKPRSHKVVYLSPQGEKWTHNKAQDWAKNCQEVTLLCGRYGGLDQRILDLYVDEEVSVGDYVLSGGELPALTLVDSISRFIPGVLGHEDSARKDSFSEYLLEAPQFTRPAVFQSLQVPEVLMSGNHKDIEKYKKDLSISVTQQKRPDLYESYLAFKNREEKKTCAKALGSLSIALMHNKVLNKQGEEIITTLTHFDIHDIARSAKTYNLKKYFIVNPVPEQLAFLSRVLDHWRLKRTKGSNRAQALGLVSGVINFDELLLQFSKKPFIIFTSAKKIAGLPIISVKQVAEKLQNKVSLQGESKEVLLLLGTGHGLSSSLLDLCDAVLEPIDTGSGFNHLSVRSALSILLDRIYQNS
ncbi:MAG: tRNA (guanosine(37)-N1)-methyltransferase TrmD [Bdellovibrionaceae bacterium]|nr:tRNA (guanosine(37)-N1)-methyltransferase TrmD [Pseudobdellovibrionaceae bacterium]